MNFTEYQVSSTFESEEMVMVHHRFNDFENLYKILRNNYEGIIIARLPEKNLLKNDTALINNRKIQLSTWLKALASHKDIKNDLMFD